MTDPRALIGVDVDLGGESQAIHCTAQDLRATFGWLLAEMRSVAGVLRPDERDVLRAIMSHAGAALSVGDLFPAFRRGGEAHRTLRRLRATQFVYPPRTGRWEPDEPVAVTPFARLAWDHLGEARLFADRAGGPAKPSAVTWDNLLDCIREQQKSRADGGGA